MPVFIEKDNFCMIVSVRFGWSVWWTSCLHTTFCPLHFNLYIWYSLNNRGKQKLLKRYTEEMVNSLHMIFVRKQFTTVFCSVSDPRVDPGLSFKVPIVWLCIHWSLMTVGNHSCFSFLSLCFLYCILQMKNAEIKESIFKEKKL